ncbi:MAG: DUF3429 domain-containing protein [Pseudomonadota bacterium]
MKQIPPAPLFLGLAGLLPFMWGTATLYSSALAELTNATVGPRFLGPYVLLNYGRIILAFMAGVLWGFAARAEGQVAATGYALSVIPALWAFFFVGAGPISAAIYLIAGFVGLLGLDYLFWQQGLTPRWWMSLRVTLTIIVVICLIPVVI